MTMYGIRSNVAWTIRSFIAKCLLSYTSSQKKVDSGDWIHTFLQHMGRQSVRLTTESNTHVSGFCQGKHFTNTLYLVFFFTFCTNILKLLDKKVGFFIIIGTGSEMCSNYYYTVILTLKRKLRDNNSTIFRLVSYFIMYTI